MNLYKLRFGKSNTDQIFEENITAVDNAEARAKASAILVDYPNLVSYELYLSGEKIDFVRDGE